MSKTRKAGKILDMRAGKDAGLEDLVKMNVFLTDLERYREMNEAYLSFFSEDPPARITVGCAGLVLNAAVEIDAIAYRPVS